MGEEQQEPGVRVQVTDPAGQVSTHELVDGRLRIGRALDNDLAISSYALSRNHAQVHLDAAGTLTVEDLGSKNGVYVNGTKVPAKTPVPFTAADTVDICGFLLRIPDEESSKPRFIADDQNPFTTSMTIDVLGASEIRSKLISASDARLLDEGRPSDAIPTSNILSAAVDLIDTKDIDEVRERVLDFVARIVGFDAGYLVSWNAEEGEAEIECSRASNTRSAGPPLSRSIIGDAAETRKPVLLLDAKTDNRYEAAQSIVGMGISSAIAAPMLSDDDKVLSVIYVMRFGGGASFTENDAHVLAYVAAVAALRFQNARLMEEALRTRFLEGELSVAAQIQTDLLPSSPPSIDGYELCEGYVACRTTSGDFYDFIPLQKDRLALALGDVSGKGVGAAMLMFSAVTVLRTLLGELKEGREFDGLLTRANRTLADTMVDGRFATALAATLDIPSGRLTYSNAAQSGMILRADGTHESLEFHGTPLGLFDDAAYGAATVELQSGDVLCLYSDGVSEARNSEREFFGDARVAEVLRNASQETAAELAARLRSTLADFIGDEPRADDMTFILLKRV